MLLAFLPASYLQYVGYDSTIEESHDPIIVLEKTLGYNSDSESTEQTSL